MIPKNAKKVFSWIIFDIYQREQEMFDWSISTFEMAKRKWTALIIPILDNWNLLVSKQEQPKIWEFIDFIGWRQEENEDLLETAKRELFEESWYKAKKLELIISKNLWISKLDWQINYYLAKWLKKVWNQNLDSWEEIDILEVSLDDLLNLNFSKNIKLDDDFEKTIKQIRNDKSILEKFKV